MYIIRIGVRKNTGCYWAGTHWNTLQSWAVRFANRCAAEEMQDGLLTGAVKYEHPCHSRIVKLVSK